MPDSFSVFTLPDRLAAKRDPVLVSADEQHFERIAGHLESAIADLGTRLDETRRMRAGEGQQALDRDQEVHRLTARLAVLRRYGLDLCLGRMVSAETGETIYIGRTGLTDSAGDRLLIDWRSPAAEPFFGATHANPMGLSSRRRYRWTRRRITDYWDEVFTAEGLRSDAALDDQSAFIAKLSFIESLGGSRSTQMRDVLGTIQADQDAIIRADSAGALVVDGGPGTGKTVVALHRTAYLLYADARLSRGHGGVLFVGPSSPYLSYVDEVLPSLGEDEVQICTLRDLVAEGASAVPEPDPAVAALKVGLLAAVEAAVAGYEQPPARTMVIHTEWDDVRLTPDDWAEAFAARDAGSSHNDARETVWNELIELLALKLDAVSPTELHRSVRGTELRTLFGRTWPVLDPAGVVADLLSVPSYLRQCAPWLTDAEVRAVQRPDARAWTVADLPLLDLARRLIGDPDEATRRPRREAALAAQREERERVIEHLVADDDSEMQVMSMLLRQDAQNSLLDESELPATDPDTLAGPFAHIVVDEAQELTDAEWRMLVSRCPSGSFTIVGDRAQARHGFAESWEERLARIGLTDAKLASLTVNYRTPAEIMVEAEPVIRATLPDANVPVSIRSNGIAVLHASADRRDELLADWLAEHDEGVACVIGDPTFAASHRVRALTPVSAKGLEFDLVVLVDPDSFGDGIEGAVDRYVAMTRATERLVVLTPSGG